MEKEPSHLDAAAGALSDSELEAISGGKIMDPETRARSNQKMMEILNSRGANVTLEQVSDNATLLDIVRNPRKYDA